MFERLLSFVRHIFDFGLEVKRYGEDIEKIERRLEDVTEALQILVHDNQRLRENIELKLQNEITEREKQKLQLENEMLKFERRLMPPSSPPRNENE